MRALRRARGGRRVLSSLALQPRLATYLRRRAQLPNQLQAARGHRGAGTAHHRGTVVDVREIRWPARDDELAVHLQTLAEHYRR